MSSEQRLFVAVFCALAICAQFRSVSWIRLQDRVQTLGKIQLNGTDCNYTIHHADNISQVAEDVQVGDQIYHKVICDLDQDSEGNSNLTDASNSTDIFPEYCLIIHNCSISNWDRSETYQLLDEQGCSLEPSIIEHAEYPSHNEAGIRAQAIRFIGDPTHTTSVFITCEARRVRRGTKGTCEDRRPRCITNEYLFKH